ncbi:protein of unknown function [Oenococcus oeni]|nr:hypothetical protein OENI_20167 [Oenococcus oeni]SYW04376.1 hypothetical protein OENI_60053 [Oenococcus oeni]SYW17501.1 hypothetical protein OENI_10169 [Oenococcus oeni]VDC14775.1 protein of unknown function [Oenococcus oeni]
MIVIEQTVLELILMNLWIIHYFNRYKRTIENAILLVSKMKILTEESIG